MGMNDVAGARASVSSAIHQQRSIDSFVEADSEQTVGLTSLMRRVEDLADRVAGPVPTEAETKDRQYQGDGYLGTLRDLHATRDQIGVRFARALDRIEQVL